MPSGSRRTLTLAAFAACASLMMTLARATPPESLYARLGGAPVVTAIVSDLIDQVVADPKLNQSYQGVDTRWLKDQIVAFICQRAGGGCHYSGPTMREAHANLHITNAQFYGMVAMLREQMRRHHVGLRERNELLAILAPMKHNIVEVNVPPPTRTQ